MPRSSAKRRHNLPALRVHLIGREHDLEVARQALLSSEGRLLTLIGTGGCGKTRLALELASDVLPNFADGVWLVELGAVADPALVAPALVSALGVRERPGESLNETLVSALSFRELLLVLDNCEHVIDVCAQLVEELLDGGPRLRVLATSRESLRVPGETTWRVPSLAVPNRSGADDDVRRSPAVQLFIERAQGSLPEIAQTPAAVAAVGRICSRLDGLPLAIELAAARVRTLGVGQILLRLDDSVRLLVGGSRTAPTRQQTLRATLDWSYGLLSDHEKVLLRRLSVFNDTWTLEAAEAVCAGTPVDTREVLDLLERLVDKSLVIVVQQEAFVRYRLLEPVRQYAHEHLIASGERDSVRRRHALAVATFVAERNIDTNKGGARRQAAAAELNTEYPNIQLALAWSVELEETQLGLRLAAGLLFLWQIRGSMGEGMSWLRQLFALPGGGDPTPARAAAVIAAAQLAQLSGDMPGGLAYCEEGLALATDFGDPLLKYLGLLFTSVNQWLSGDLAAAYETARLAAAEALAGGDEVGVGQALARSAAVACDQEDYAAAQPLAEQALRLALATRDVWNEAFAQNVVGRAALGLGDFQRAQTAFEAALSAAYQQGESPYVLTQIFDGLGDLAIALGQPRQAHDWLLRSVELHHQGGAEASLARTLDRLAALAANCGWSERALRLSGAADCLYQKSKSRRLEAERLRVERWQDALRSALGDQATNRAVFDGRELTLDAALALVRDGDWDTDKQPDAKPRDAMVLVSPGADLLTAREQEVAVLLARGLSNPQIASELTISVHTAQRHVENILGKLDFSSRTQVATWAVGHGLIKAQSVDAPT